MSVNGPTTSNTQAQQFLGSLTDEQKTKYSQGQQDAKALEAEFSKDANGAEKKKKFSEAMKEDNPLKKMMMLKDFEDSLNPEEKKMLNRVKEDSKDFTDSLKDDQKDKQKDLGKNVMENGKASVGGVFDLSS